MQVSNREARSARSLDSDDARARLRAARDAAAQRLARLDRLAEEASQLVHDGRSTTGVAAASVDGNGRLLAVRVDPAALRTVSPERVGHEVVTAVSAARELAATEHTRLVQERLGSG